MDELARRAGITRKTAGRIENGHAVRISTIKDLERAFEVPEGTIARAYYGETNLRDALSELDSDEPTGRLRAPNITRTGEADRAVAGPDDSPDTPPQSLGDLVDGIMRDRGYIDVESAAPRTAAEAFELVQHLPLPELRRLRDRLDAVVQFLERPVREEAIHRAVARMHAIGAHRARADMAASQAVEDRKRAAATGTDADRKDAERAADYAAMIASHAHAAYREQLEAMTHELSKMELAEVMSRLGERPHGED